MTSHREFVEKNLSRNYRKQVASKGGSYTDIPVSLHLQKSESMNLLTDDELDEH